MVADRPALFLEEMSSARHTFGRLDLCRVFRHGRRLADTHVVRWGGKGKHDPLVGIGGLRTRQVLQSPLARYTAEVDAEKGEREIKMNDALERKEWQAAYDLALSLQGEPDAS